MDDVAEKESLDVHRLVSEFPDAPGATADRHDASSSGLFPVRRNARSGKGEIPNKIFVIR